MTPQYNINKPMTQTKQYSSNHWTKKIEEYNRKLGEARKNLSAAKIRESHKQTVKNMKKDVLVQRSNTSQTTVNRYQR